MRSVCANPLLYANWRTPLASHIQIICPLKIFALNPESHRNECGCPAVIDARVKKRQIVDKEKTPLAGDKQPRASADRLAAAAASLAATWSRRAPGLSFRTC